MKSILVAATLIFMSGCAVVGPGEVGIRVFLGKTNSEQLDSGSYLWVPFVYSVKTLTVRVQKSEVNTSSASRDMQEVSTHLAINWTVPSDKAVRIFNTLGDEDVILNNIIAPAANEVLKAATAKYAAEEILTKRLDLKDQIDTSLKRRLETYGLLLNDVSIVNLTFSREFTHAIEAKQIAEQRSLEAEYEAQKAEKDAKAKVNLARGEAEAQKLLKASITSDIIQLRAIEKWNGVMPAVQGGSNMLFNIPVGGK